MWVWQGGRLLSGGALKVIGRFIIICQLRSQRLLLEFHYPHVCSEKLSRCEKYSNVFSWLANTRVVMLTMLKDLSVCDSCDVCSAHTIKFRAMMV